MSSINLSKTNSLNFTGVIYTRNNHKPTANDLDQYDNYPKYSDAMSSYGRAMVSKPENPYLNLLKRLEATADNETMSIEDAISEFSDIDTSSKKKTDFIMACCYETDSSEPIINKKAVLTLKESLISQGRVPKLEDAIRTCLDEEKQEFNSIKFENLYNSDGKLKLSAKLKPRKQNYDKNMRNAKAERFMSIFNAVEAQSANNKKTSGDFKNSDLFVPLSSIRTQLKNNIATVEDIPDDLRESMNNSVDNNDFNLRQVHSDYYSLLNDCKTLSDVEMFYPKLSYPEKPVADPKSSVVSFENRLSKENYDEIAIDILKKSYIDIKPKDDIRISLEHSRPTSYRALEHAGYKFSYPSKELQNLLNESDKTYSRYKDMPTMTEDEIDKTTKKHAIRKSKVWADYHEMTSKDWLPVRLIKNKRLKPKDSEYRTDKLVNTYLLNLYKRNPNGDYSANPLERYETQKGLSQPAKSIINNVYYTRLKRDEDGINNPEFLSFSNKFDKKAIGKSLEAMENNYTKAFFKQYWTQERLDSLKENLQTSSDLIYEKILLNEQIIPKVFTDEDVNKIIEDDLSTDITSAPEIDENKLAHLKYLSTNIRNSELKQRCRDCTSSKNVDLAYFNSVYKIINESVDDKLNLDENKAMTHIMLHDKYLHHVFNTSENISEEDYINAELSPYRSEDGSIDYGKVKNDIELESKYISLADKLMDNGDYEIVSLAENTFINENKDFKNANHLLEIYSSTPDTFKNKIVTTFQSKTKINPKILMEDIDSLHQKIMSWNFDKDEIITMDEDKIPQNVVITHKAKKELFDIVGGNLETFDAYYKKIYSAAQHRTGDANGQGIKSLKDVKDFDVEIKIKGKGGGIRLYGAAASDEMKQKYATNDGISVKYIFDCCDGHL